jgi:choline oxidase
VQEFDELSDYVRRTGNTVYHPAGTCAMGADVNSNSVVDSKLRVRGVEGLRVADASVFPTHVSVNPNMTVMMIAERCASFICEDA